VLFAAAGKQPTEEPMTIITETIRNGVDTEQMYGTLDAIPTTCSSASSPRPARQDVRQ